MRRGIRQLKPWDGTDGQLLGLVSNRPGGQKGYAFSNFSSGGVAMNSQSWHDQFALPKVSNGRTRIILSVDDEPAILSTRQSILESAGFRVLSAPDGEAALRLFLSQQVDLVLLDYVMPGLDGGAVAKEMKRQRQNVPVILVSASPVPEDIAACVDYRCDKGEGPLPLLKKVSEFLAHSLMEISSSEPRRNRQLNRKGEDGNLASPDKGFSASVRKSLSNRQELPEKTSDVLTCWKEIAQYFGKGVRTVQRWEHEAGLPVRRHHGEKGRVFALPQDLEAWLQSSTAWPQQNSESEVARLRKTVTELSLENEMLRRRLAVLEEIVVVAESDSHKALLHTSRRRSFSHSDDIRASQKSETAPARHLLRKPASGTGAARLKEAPSVETRPALRRNTHTQHARDRLDY